MARTTQKKKKTVPVRPASHDSTSEDDMVEGRDFWVKARLGRGRWETDGDDSRPSSIELLLRNVEQKDSWARFLVKGKYSYSIHRDGAAEIVQWMYDQRCPTLRTATAVQGRIADMFDRWRYAHAIAGMVDSGKRRYTNEEGEIRTITDLDDELERTCPHYQRWAAIFGAVAYEHGTICDLASMVAYFNPRIEQEKEKPPVTPSNGRIAVGSKGSDNRTKTATKVSQTPAAGYGRVVNRPDAGVGSSPKAGRVAMRSPATSTKAKTSHLPAQQGHLATRHDPGADIGANPEAHTTDTTQSNAKLNKARPNNAKRSDAKPTSAKPTAATLVTPGTAKRKSVTAGPNNVKPNGTPTSSAKSAAATLVTPATGKRKSATVGQNNARPNDAPPSSAKPTAATPASPAAGKCKSAAFAGQSPDTRSLGVDGSADSTSKAGNGARQKLTKPTDTKNTQASLGTTPMGTTPNNSKNAPYPTPAASTSRPSNTKGTSRNTAENTQSSGTTPTGTRPNKSKNMQSSLKPTPQTHASSVPRPRRIPSAPGSSRDPFVPASTPGPSRHPFAQEPSSPISTTPATWRIVKSHKEGPPNSSPSRLPFSVAGPPPHTVLGQSRTPSPPPSGPSDPPASGTLPSDTPSRRLGTKRKMASASRGDASSQHLDPPGTPVYAESIKTSQEDRPAKQPRLDAGDEAAQPADDAAVVVQYLQEPGANTALMKQFVEQHKLQVAYQAEALLLSTFAHCKQYIPNLSYEEAMAMARKRVGCAGECFPNCPCHGFYDFFKHTRPELSQKERKAMSLDYATRHDRE